MNFVKSLFMRAFGRPTGFSGRLGGIIMARMNQRIAQRAIELLDVQPSDSVLEVGFGSGMGIELLARSASSGRVASIDPSEEMVEQAGARHANAIRARRVDLRRGSVESLPFENSLFDKALAINSMQVWSDAVLGLQEIQRVLKPGGAVVLGFTRHSGQTKEGLTKTLTAAGFAGARVVDDMDGGNFCALAVKL
jgi:ubiquinone/menaquinone biosynthesis C-methylase UbiE